MTMLTVSEAMQRARQYGIRIKRACQGSTEWLVTLEEWNKETCIRAGYFTDDLEDALFSGMKMRRDHKGV